MMEGKFDAERYWSHRLEQRFTLDGVGWIGLGEPFNRWMYAVRAQVFRRVVRATVDVPHARVLDVGSGTGFYLGLWHGLGAREIVGSDLSGVAVDRLRARFPAMSIEQVDVSEGSERLEGPFDAISAMDVLFHIVDDDAYARAVGNLAGLLAPGGVLVLSENLLHGNTVRGEHQVSRSLREVEGLVRSAGLVVERRSPLFVLMNTPVDSDSPVLRTTWRALRSLAGRGFGGAAGALVFPFEVALTRVVSEGPSTEIVVCRKPAA
jgi:SAM-dependent methyltransferase